MVSQENPLNRQDATLALLESAGSELDLLKLSGDIDANLLDASLDEYQYDPHVILTCTFTKTTT